MVPYRSILIFRKTLNPNCTSVQYTEKCLSLASFNLFDYMSMWTLCSPVPEAFVLRLICMTLFLLKYCKQCTIVYIQYGTSSWLKDLFFCSPATIALMYDVYCYIMHPSTLSSTWVHYISLERNIQRNMEFVNLLLTNYSTNHSATYST